VRAGAADQRLALCWPQDGPEGEAMLKLTLRYSRYALTALVSVGFMMSVPNN
jgi:hypothetical protein